MIVVQVQEHGNADVLQIAEVDPPEVAAGRVVVEVAAAGVNFIDTYHRSGLYEVDLPFVLGLEGAGRVTAVGSGVDDLAVGDTVAWTDVAGSYAEYVSLPAERVVPVPDGIGAREAAAAMLQGITAHYLATSTFALQAGHRCLIHAGAGGVGRLLIQVAKHLGAEVFTTVGSEDKARVAAEAGADHVIRYRDEPFDAAIERIAGQRPLDVVYDGVGASTFQAGLGLLKPRGLMVSFGNASGPVPPVSPLDLLRNGSLYLTRPGIGSHIAERVELLERTRDMFGWMRDGVVDVLVGASYPLEEAATAHRALEGRATTGKVLLELGSA